MSRKKGRAWCSGELFLSQWLGASSRGDKDKSLLWEEPIIVFKWAGALQSRAFKLIIVLLRMFSIAAILQLSPVTTYTYHMQQLSNLWWMPNLVSKGFAPAMRTDSSRWFQRYLESYMICEFQVGFLLLGIKAYPPQISEKGSQIKTVK